ncbi:hypothetical protein HWV62_41553 [Athelia sp. TMB]|nr:hypothetical protein HWV62_41553 [Athelia sp. TMB]
MAPQRRLTQILSELTPALPSIGTLTLGDITYGVPAALNPTRLSHSGELLDVSNSINADNLHFLLQKYLLGQDVFLVSQPGPYARRLALTFASLINAEYELIGIHRDIGETELKQGREIRAGGQLVYVDSPAVRAVKSGRILILEGIEKAERGIMPILNNLLENREMNLDDGTHIIHPHRFAQLSTSASDGKLFIPAHKNFRVIAIAAPVPPYPGYPIDPPFRSRFQARFCDPVGSLLALASGAASTGCELVDKVKDIILATQYASEARDSLEAVSKSALPAFPQTALAKLGALAAMFPPPPQLSPGQLARLFLTLHPGLLHAPFEAWAMLSRQTTECGLGELGSPSNLEDDEGLGLLGYRVIGIEPGPDSRARVSFAGHSPLSVSVPAGPYPLRPFPFSGPLDFHPTPRFLGLLTSFLQAHALGWDISYLPPALPSTASCSTSTLVKVFGDVLGYGKGEAEVVHMYKEMGGRELVMRRRIEDGVEGAWKGRLVHLAGLDVLGATAGSLARLVQDRELELWEGKRIVAEAEVSETSTGELSVAHPSFRLIATASKSLPLKDWLSAEHANMFFPIAAQPMTASEESAVLAATGCPLSLISTLIPFANKYRESMSADTVQKNRKLGTRSLVRIARRVAAFPNDDDLHGLITRSLLAEFLPAVERMNLDELLEDAGIKKKSAWFNPSPVAQEKHILFPEISSPGGRSEPTSIPRFDAALDPEGVASHVPHMDHFYDNSIQTGSMRDLAVDMEVLGEHLVLLGNQLLGRPREYIQLHRDTTVNQLMFTTSLEHGVIKHTDSPLLRAIIHGRVIIIDEADKAPEHVVAIFRSLAGQGEMTLSDGRRVRRASEREGDIVVHPKFRLILLANRPGYPFLGNHFLQVLGDNFSCHSVVNPDHESERKLLAQLAPELPEDIIRRLVFAFQDLRKGYDSGILAYPYSLRELINLVRHMRAYPKDDLATSLRNIFDFDVYKPETIERLAEILEHYGLAVKHLGLEAAREAATKKIHEMKFEPTGSTELDEPKEGDHDDKPHEGGNRWAGGSGGRDTAGQGGRGGYKRLYKGHKIMQVSDQLKDNVPDHIKEKARQMAREELQRRLEELNMSVSEAKGYGQLLEGVDTHIRSLHDLLEHLAAKEEERVWVKRQTDGELDDSRLTEGITGEATVYKRRGMEKPEIGRPQMKPKRIRFVFDISGSMYRFQYDGRLQRSLETAVMLMEAFDRVSRKEKYAWDIYGHSGESPTIPLCEANEPPAELRDRWKIVEKMSMVTQYAFSGDYTVEAIEKSVQEVAKYDADDWFVIAITDANFGRYNITPDDLKRVMNKDPKVHTALICIGDGAESSWVTKALPGRGFRVSKASDIPTVMRSILSTMVDR